MTFTLDALIGNGINIVFALIVALIARKFAAILVDKYFSRVYKSAQSRGRSISKKRLNTLARAFKSISNVIIWTLFVVTVLGMFNVKLTALLTGAGATAIIFGIAGRDIIMDLYVGFMALIEDQYRVGDDIEISKDHAGIVEEVTLRTVKLRDTDGYVHIVPHSLARSIINKTYDYSLVTVDFTTEYVEDRDALKTIVDTAGLALSKDSQWSKVFVEPIKYDSTLAFDKEALTFKAQGKVKPGKQVAAESEFRLRIVDALEKDGIHIPGSAEATDIKSPKKKSKAKAA